MRKVYVVSWDYPNPEFIIKDILHAAPVVLNDIVATNILGVTVTLEETPYGLKLVLLEDELGGSEILGPEFFEHESWENELRILIASRIAQIISLPQPI